MIEPPGVLHRLGDDQSHLVRPGIEHGALDLCQQPGAERFGVVPVRRSERVRVGDVGDLDRRRTEVVLEARNAGEGQRAERDAVVRDLPGDRLPPLRLADRDVVLADELPSGLHRLRAAAGEEDPVVVGRGQRRDPLGQLDAPPGGRSPSSC